jgi:hypothetical protein
MYSSDIRITKNIDDISNEYGDYLNEKFISNEDDLSQNSLYDNNNQIELIILHPHRVN